MKYRVDPKSGNKLSVLGFGCMRFPSDIKKTENLILKAVNEGVNYFDTAYIYPKSEEALGVIVHNNDLRDKIYIATKLPLSLVFKADDMEKLFQTQLERLKTDHIDYYLMHNMSDIPQWERLCGLGVREWIAKKKASGAVRQIGFSYHGNRQDFFTMLDAYDWDFCQIQYNFLDEHNQAGVEGLKRAAGKGLPVIIMEPLLGGKLAKNLPKQAAQAFSAADPNVSPARWAFRWLYDQPEVSVVLSGMNDDAQLVDNLQTAAQSAPGIITAAQKAVFAKAIDLIKESYKVPCTGCAYCMPCPKNVNIPACFNAYNISYSMGFGAGMMSYANGAGLTQTRTCAASQCVSCGKCEKHCPQHIQVSKELKAVRKRLEPFYIKWVIKLIGKFMAKGAPTD